MDFDFFFEGGGKGENFDVAKTFLQVIKGIPILYSVLQQHSNLIHRTHRFNGQGLCACKYCINRFQFELSLLGLGVIQTFLLFKL